MPATASPPGTASQYWSGDRGLAGQAAVTGQVIPVVARMSGGRGSASWVPWRVVAVAPAADAARTASAAGHSRGQRHAERGHERVTGADAVHAVHAERGNQLTDARAGQRGPVRARGDHRVLRATAEQILGGRAGLGQPGHGMAENRGRLGLVHNQPGHPGPQQRTRVSRGGRQVEQTGHPGGAGPGQDGPEHPGRDLRRQHQQVAGHRQRRRGLSVAGPAVRPRSNRDHVLARRVHRDQRQAGGGPRHRPHPGDVDALGLERRPGCPGEIIISGAAHHAHRAAEPGGGYGLVRSLAAGRDDRSRAEHRLPGTGQPAHGDRDIRVQAPEDGEPRAPWHGSLLAGFAGIAGTGQPAALSVYLTTLADPAARWRRSRRPEAEEPEGPGQPGNRGNHGAGKPRSREMAAAAGGGSAARKVVPEPDKT